MLAGSRYVGKFEDGRVAVGSGPLRQVKILAAIVSSPTAGVGKTVCIYKLGGAKKTKKGGDLVECYVRGAKVPRRRR